MIRDRTKSVGISESCSTSGKTTGWKASFLSWAMRPRNVSTGQLLLITVSALCLAHFLPGFYCMGLLMTSKLGRGGLYYFLFTLPYVGLWLLFATSLVLAVRRRVRWSALVLAVALVISIALCAYDLTHYHRAQLDGSGHGPLYVFWWWYSEPFWCGYKPGNV